jgi:quinol-cytochrome oxidoreductase complex cytochrome b subunit
MRFFALHIMIIPVTALTLISAHLYNVRRDGGLLARDNTEKIKSDPHLYRLAAIIGASAVILTVVLSVIFGAPLCEPANPAEPPNPAKSAWFLLWIQEIVSWRASLFNAVALLFVLYFFLPDFRKSYTPESSVWFDKRDTLVWGITLLICASAIVLTVIAMFFRGENWSLVPFYF